MKKVLFAALAALVSACSSDGFNVTVEFKGADSLVSGFVTADTLVLKNMSRKAEDVFEYASSIKDNKAKFAGETDTPDTYGIFLGKEANRPLATLFLENCKMNVTVALSESTEENPNGMEITVKGGAVQNTIDSLNTLIKDLEREYDVNGMLSAYYAPGAEEQTKDSIVKLFDQLDERANAIKNNYIESHPTSHYTLSQIISKIADMPLDEVEKALAAFKTPEFAGNRKLVYAKELVEKLRTLQPGAQAPEFTQNDPDGNPVSLSDVVKENKVTMIDFWASWCTPCRNFNPKLTKIYEKYHKKGLGILGVSLDKVHENWVKAIEDDKLVWKHVSDLKYWNNEVAELYMVKFVPQNIFLDQEGKVIKRHVKEDEIEALLDEYLK